MDSKQLDILVCPICKGKLQFFKEQNQLCCKACQLGFPIEDRVPVMLESRANTLKDLSSKNKSKTQQAK